eukprot:4073785-Pyramimonas_sp.AAC.2
MLTVGQWTSQAMLRRLPAIELLRDVLHTSELNMGIRLPCFCGAHSTCKRFRNNLSGKGCVLKTIVSVNPGIPGIKNT